MGAGRTLVMLMALCMLGAVGCNEDPFAEMLAGEDLGTGVVLGSAFSEVPATIASTFGKSFAERNVSMDRRYLKFMDPYGDYALIVTDLDQDRKVDALMVVVYARRDEDADEKLKRFRTGYPHVRTKKGITIGDPRTDVLEAYQMAKHRVKDTRWVDSSVGHLYFCESFGVIGGIWLVDDRSRSVSYLIGDDHL